MTLPVGTRLGPYEIVAELGAEPLRKVADFPTSARVRGMAPSPDGDSAVLGRYVASSDIVLFTTR